MFREEEPSWMVFLEVNPSTNQCIDERADYVKGQWGMYAMAFN